MEINANSPISDSGSDNTTITSGQSAGSYIDPRYTMRSQTMYTLPDTELRNISHLNTMAIILFSIGSFILSITVSIFVDYLTSASTKMTKYEILGITFCTIISIIFYVLGIWQLSERSGLLKQIHDESKEIRL